VSSTPVLRRAGLLIPLFSSPSTSSWGIGEIGDVAATTAWLAAGGQRVLQLLPLNAMARHEKSPYSANSAMAIDPIFITVAAIPEFAALGGEDALRPADRIDLDRVRMSSPIDHAAVRRLKDDALAAAFERFTQTEWLRDTERARHFKAFIASQAWWLEDHALFTSIHDREHDRPWTKWPEGLRRREGDAVAEAGRELANDVLRHQYLQWVADSQWRDARRAAAVNGVALFGDMPFIVNEDSVDVWVRQHEFRLDVTVGAPPDAFSATGQDWGMPAYNWDEVAASDFAWLRSRARRAADLYDGYRIDHVVGFYRTFCRPRDGAEPFFSPWDEASQLALGERILGVLQTSRAEVVAEDLGTVPDFVRDSLERLGIPGFRIPRWERHWHMDGQPFRDPTEFPACSVAASGTHDTEPLAIWWELASSDDRSKVSALPAIQRLTRGAGLQGDQYDSTIRDVILESLFESGSDLLLNVVQDVFGWRDRINQPAFVTADNWTFRLPWPIDRVADIPEAGECQARLRAWCERYGRT
jgi:4-alpha-glucanotransferase